MSRAFADVLREQARGIADLSESQVSALNRHYELLVRWNKVLNLTRVTDAEHAVKRHYLESLFLAAQLPTGTLSICDIGSGPGFPGFPVAVFRQDCSVTLIEAHQRKAVFLRDATRDVANVTVLPARAEGVVKVFDWSVSRAVSYEDLRIPLSRLAPAAALLTGADAPPSDWGWDWDQAIPLPHGHARFLRLGRRET